MRLLNFCLVILLVLATAYVYEIKFDATMRAAKVFEMRGQVRRERDAIAALRAEAARLENPGRLEDLARRHLTLRAPELSQFDSLDHLPNRRPVEMNRDPVATKNDFDDSELPTAGISPNARTR